MFYFVWTLALDSFSKYQRVQVLDHKVRMWMIFFKEMTTLSRIAVVWLEIPLEESKSPRCSVFLPAQESLSAF